jgi:hypothetical protein
MDSARLQFLAMAFPQWVIGQERHMWTATYRPTPTSLWFIYAFDLGQLERELYEAENPRGDAVP